MSAFKKPNGPATWQWFGMAGHFIGAHDCLFHLHTHVGRFCVSTVGNYWPKGERLNQQDSPVFEEIGYNRYFDTMVFYLLSEGGDADWARPVFCTSAQTNDEANENHILTCETVERDYVLLIKRHMDQVAETLEN